ncbi:MAG TPA: VCBS repeat-containing protein, partial [Thermoanaerobaculia bacterium]|nr:VCBS repeat-containing protein [Thermoanaerobaculia bacterium]
EPLGWADGAVVAMREKDLAGAQTLLAQARRLSPGDARVLSLHATLEELKGSFSAAVEAAEKAAAASPKDLVSRWTAARLLSEKIGNGSSRAIEQLSAALESAPANLFLLARLFELELPGAERSRATATFEKLARALEAETRADAKVQRYLSETKTALESGDSQAVSLKFRIVENLLRVSPRYQQARRDVDPGVVGLPLEDWSPVLAAAVRARPRGVPVRFVERPAPGLGALERISAVRAGGRDGRDLVFVGESGVTVAFAREGYRTGPALPSSVARDVAVADLTGSGQLDLVTPNGLWMGGREPRKVPFSGGEHVLPLDYDNDGDLDLYVTSPSGDRLWRNNLDGTWTDVTATALPPGVASRALCAADFDRDGDVDLVLARASGGLLLLDNLRGGRFAEREAGLPKSGAFLSVAAADLNADGRPDLIWTTETAAFVAINRGDGTFLPARELPGGGQPLLFDFDNDGALDLFLASSKGSSLWRNDGSGNFRRVEGVFPPAIAAESVDLDGDGDLDLVLVTPEGKALLLENQGGNANGWIDVALEGLPTGSAKVNRFGYGSEVEVKAGALYAFRTVSRPVTHVGVGAARKADVLRVLWTNGIPQNRLSPAVKTLVTEIQQLKGSCPFLYAFDGQRWSFVTDALGRAPAGLLYDGVHQAPADTREWLLVSGEKLAPQSNGRLVLDFTEELWETAYFDLAQLEAVDHPKGTEIVPNEKMVPPPFPKKSLFTISHPFTPRATDERGRDRTQEIAREDGTFLADLAPTRYQGIVEPHDLILEMPGARAGKRVVLYLTGWIFYADTSINVSLSQGERPEKPFGPTLEVPDGRGGWRVA